MTTTHKQSQVLVVGAGAAGCMAAIAAARAGVNVMLAEKNGRVAQSILATGNGRCNLSNEALDERGFATHYNVPAFVSILLYQHGCASIRKTFKVMGLLTYFDYEGRVYPQTNSAVSVVDVLRHQLAKLKVDIVTDTAVQAVEPSANGGFEIATSNGNITANAVILASGSDKLLKSIAGHDHTKQTPVLGPLSTSTEPLRGLDGVRVRCTATLLRGSKTIANQAGELLFRAYGLSGIMIFELSRHAQTGDTVRLDFMNGLHVNELDNMLRARCNSLGACPAQNYLDGMLHPRLTQAVLRHLQVSPSTPFTKPLIDKLIPALTDFRLEVTAGPTPEQAQVMRGGLDTRQFDPLTLQSKVTPGLFACGEALDVDGATGGFNLHWAWVSGYQSGVSAAELLS